MSSSSPVARREPEGPGGDVRLRIAASARELFAAQGYEQTTVEAIAERAGVARRTFFRHFRSKDDAIFPDHARIAAVTESQLAALQELPPLSALAIGVKTVFRSYVDDPVISVQRYRLTRSVPALRDRETASVSVYTRMFSHYLRGRFGDAPNGAFWADVIAAAFVAAHNYVLRGWLQRSGEGDPLPELEAAFESVAARLRDAVPAGAAVAPSGSGTTGSGVPAPAAAQGDGEDVVVAVFRSGEPIDDVVERISRSL
jgi:AcrR family transcriptional regulator